MVSVHRCMSCESLMVHWIRLIVGVRSEFEGDGELSIFRSPSFSLDSVSQCLVLFASFNSSNIDLRFSLFTFPSSSSVDEAGKATAPLPDPVVKEVVNTSQSGGRDFYVELPPESSNETWLQLVISASQYYNGSRDYAAVTLVGTERRACLDAGNNASTLRFLCLSLSV